MEANALAGDDSITLPAGIYMLTIAGTGEDAAATGDLDIRGSLTITGAGSDATIIDAAYLDRVFDVFPGVSFGISAITVTRGLTSESGGGIYIQGGTVNIDSSTLSGNRASGTSSGGGGITNYGVLIVSNTTLSTNRVTGQYGAGGGISNSGTLTIRSSILTGNTADNLNGRAGGIYNFMTGTVVMADSVLSGNKSYTYGGGIYNYAGTLELADCTLFGNSTLREGGAIYLAGGTATITDSTLSANSVGTSTMVWDGYGGAVSVHGASLTIGGSAFTENTVTGGLRGYGGALYSSDFAAVTIGTSTLSNNSAKLSGGAIRNNATSSMTITNGLVADNSANGSAYGDGGGISNGGNLTIITCSLSGNNAFREGGGIFSSGRLDIVRSAFSGNLAAYYGGGLYNAGVITLANSTLSGNSTSFFDGGGIYNAAGTATIASSTIGRNTAGYDSKGGGIYNSADAIIDVTNTIVADNTSTQNPDLCGNVSSRGYNAIGDVCGSSGWVVSDKLNVDPMLGPLADNGGPTLTHALLVGSPAIDAGDNTGAPATDQRGSARVVDGDGNGTATIDIGAFEYAVLNEAPTADAGGGQTGYVGFEGSPILFDASASFDPDGDTLQFRWDFDGDGNWDTSWSETSSAENTWNDDWSGTAKVEVGDGQFTDSDTANVTVLNVAPTATFNFPTTLDEDKLIILSLTSPFDPSSVDTAAGFEYAFDFGDGYGEWGRDSQASSSIPLDNGDRFVRGKIRDKDGGETEYTGTVSVANVAPNVTISPTPASMSVQYSDYIESVITISATDVPGDLLGAVAEYSSDGGSTFDSLSSWLSFTGTGTGGSGTWAIAKGTTPVDVAPGTYLVRVTVSDGDGGSAYVDATIEVEPEDALAFYTGALCASTASIDSGLAVIALSATIQDVDDGARGDIQNATVTFYADGVSVAGPLAVQLVNPGDTTTGTVACQWTTDIKNVLSTSFTVVVKADGYYAGTDWAVVNVSKPAPDFITGGGYLVNEYSAGTYAGDTSLHTNFGVNVKFNKQLTNLQGNVNIIVRQDESVYQIKANAMNSLAVDPVSSTATITTKANLTDITDPFNPRLIAGNLMLAVNLTDGGEPGSSDSIGLTLWGTTGTLAGRLLFSSRWDGIQTVEQNLAGGNLAVHAAGQALQAAGGAGATAAGQQMLTLKELQPLAEQAIAAWSIAGLDRESLSHLSQVELRIADLSGSTLGLAFANTIWIDRDAAGYGWRIDAADSAGKMDLLSVVSHEFGHTLGFEHSDERALMFPTLAAGVQTVIVPDSFAENLFAVRHAHFFGSYSKQSASSWLRKDTVSLNTLGTEWAPAEKPQTLRARDDLFAALAVAERAVAVEGVVRIASDDEIGEAIGYLSESLLGATGLEEATDKATEHLFDENLAELLALGL